MLQEQSGSAQEQLKKVKRKEKRKLPVEGATVPKVKVGGQLRCRPLQTSCSIPTFRSKQIMP